MSAFACSLGCGKTFSDSDGEGLERADRHEARCGGTPRAARKPTERVRRARRGPTNSAGEPFVEGESHDLRFHPVEHAAKIAARKESAS